MAALGVPGGYGGGSHHGGQIWRRSSDRRRTIGILCSILLLVELGGLLIQVYLLLTTTSFVENPDFLYSLQLPDMDYGYVIYVTRSALASLKKGFKIRAVL